MQDALPVVTDYMCWVWARDEPSAGHAYMMPSGWSFIDCSAWRSLNYEMFAEHLGTVWDLVRTAIVDMDWRRVE